MRGPLLFVSTVLIRSSLTKAAVLHSRGPVCTDIRIPVSIHAENLALPTTLAATNLETFINGLGSSLFDLGTNIIDETYEIAGTYCEPEVYNSDRANTIHLLVHGITYDRHYWDGLSHFAGATYSWVDYFSKEGYPTLAIDRLGAGLSDHPDGILEVQLPAQVEVTHALVETLKSGGVGGRLFNTIIYVGHSYGSLIGNAHSANYPTDCAAYILTGWTDQLKLAIPGALVNALPIPAAIARPAAFAHLPVTYLTLSTKAGFDALFFTKATSSSQLRQLNFDTRGTVTVGEAATAFLANDVAVNYTGAIFVLTGEKDAIFCPIEILGIGLGAALGMGNCGTGVNSKPSQSRRLYPNARAFGYEVVKGVGHCNIVHFGADAQAVTVIGWLDGVGF